METTILDIVSFHVPIHVSRSGAFADEDSNGEIDKEELKHCFQKLEISFTEEEICDLFEACDINEDMGMKFNEFIVFLCLVYLLNEPAVSEAVSFISHINSHSNILIVLLVLLSHCVVLVQRYANVILLYL